LANDFAVCRSDWRITLAPASLARWTLLLHGTCTSTTFAFLYPLASRCFDATNEGGGADRRCCKFTGRSWGTTTARASLKRLARAWNFHRSKITRDSSLQLIIMRSADGLTLQLQMPDTVGRCQQPTTRIRRNFSAMFRIIESSTPEWLSTCAWCNLASCVDWIKILSDILNTLTQSTVRYNLRPVVYDFR